ncbi:MAG TPA: FIST N-terminal domain-containing protein, partial [Arenicellales bacterium]|nr:FIST N-terminal domain-containing protein [Arenicellales bacterium]
MKEQPHKQPDTEFFRYGHSAGADWEQAADQCLRQLGYIPPETNLGFLYVTDTHATILPSILAHFRAQTGVDDWVGTVGMGICATGVEYYETPAMAAMVGAFAADDYRILPALQSLEMNELDPLAGWLADSAAHLGIVHGDPRNAAGPELIERLAARLPGG